MKICKRCVMDESDPNIVFDSNGYCNHCSGMIEYLKGYPFSLPPDEKEQELIKLVSKIKEKGVGKNFDCIIGLSGGVDSTYVAYLVKKLGLNPLAIHLDNGWNSELAEKNIEETCKILGIELYTRTVNWEEFRKLQLAFLYASTPDCEIPSDHAIVSTLFEIAKKNDIHYILAGTNALSEYILPKAWSQGHRDYKYIKAINKNFGGEKLKTFPHRSFLKQIKYKKIDKINLVSILDYVDYNKDEAKEFIKRELNWSDYGYKHYESIYTRIYQSYILYEKFGIDKRKAHFSSQIVSGQMDREEALRLLKELPYNKETIKDDVKYLSDKLQISEQEFYDIMQLEPKRYEDYPNISFLMNGYLMYRKIKRFISDLKYKKKD